MSLLSTPAAPGSLLLGRPEPSASPAESKTSTNSLSSTVQSTVATAELPAVATVPMQIIHDCIGHILSLELVSREIYRGRLVTFDRETMNLEMGEVTLTRRDGEVKRMETVYLRGNKVRFVRLPDVAETHPVFKELKELESKPRQVKQLMGTRGRGRGRGGRGGPPRGRGGFGGRGGGPPRPGRSSF